MDESTELGRRNGIEFDQLAEKLTAVEYPVASTDLFEALGDHELRIADGTRTVQETLEPLVATRGGTSGTTPRALRFASAEEVVEAVVGMVDEGAIGRKAYSDRTPPVPGERTQRPDESV